MPNLEASHEGLFSSSYRHIVKQFHSVMEPCPPPFEPAGKGLREELVRCIWFGQHIRKTDLRTEDGARMEVLTPGWWNVEAGPDLKHAEIIMEGKGLVKGDVEVHVNAPDWARHGHAKNKEYNNVCLHVVMWNDSNNNFVTNSKGDAIPQIALHKHLEMELDELAEVVDIEDYLRRGTNAESPCQKKLSGTPVNERWLGQFLDQAGDERVLVKARGYEKRLENTTFEQALYEAVMESLGYRDNRLPFLRLASVAPLSLIRRVIPVDAGVKQKSLRIQALLFGMGGLLQRLSGSKKDFDTQTQRYIKRASGIWSELKSKMPAEPIDGRAWQFGRLRPANSPTRRVAAMSNILAGAFETGLFRFILKFFEEAGQTNVKTITQKVKSIFLETHDDFWSYYYVFGGKRLNSPERLIGEERASAIFVNIVIPLLLVYARRHGDVGLEKTLHCAYRSHRKLSSDRITKFMNCRVLPPLENRGSIITNARRQQGLYQIYKDFCSNNNVNCSECSLLQAMDSADGYR
ncbi:MAG TPA: DUF2851 family protein [Candidatus Brocadiia bacterium]|nr:DUF2851 family protein [Candidatus Brocadiales bacterium]